MSTQCDRLRHRLETGRAVTALDAWAELGIARLAARVWDLRREGTAVRRRMIDVTNRWGETCSVAEYSLPREETQSEMAL